MSSRIGKTGWIMTYALAGGIDLLQWLLDLTGIGAGVNEVADPFIGIFFIAYFQLRGVSMLSRAGRLASLLGATALEEFSFSIAPAWIADVWYIHQSVRQEDSQEEAAAQNQARMTIQNSRPLNVEGMRAPQAEGGEYAEEDSASNIIPFPQKRNQPYNIDGIRKAA